MRKAQARTGLPDEAERYVHACGNELEIVKNFTCLHKHIKMVRLRWQFIHQISLIKYCITMVGLSRNFIHQITVTRYAMYQHKLLILVQNDKDLHLKVACVSCQVHGH